MTKLSDLKVGDKFRWAGENLTYELVSSERLTESGRAEYSYWSDITGFHVGLRDIEVELVTEPQYRPYSDLRVLVGKVLLCPKQKSAFVVVYATKDDVIVGADDGYNLRYSQYVLDNYTHLDGTPCGELVE